MAEPAAAVGVLLTIIMAETAATEAAAVQHTQQMVEPAEHMAEAAEAAAEMVTIRPINRQVGTTREAAELAERMAEAAVMALPLATHMV